MSAASTPARLLLLFVAIAACDDATAPVPEQNSIVPEIQAATAAYRQLDAAVAAGFEPVSPCVAVEGLGAMGFHYLSGARLGDAVIDASSPEILLFAPNAAGALEMVGVEFMLMADAWDAQSTAPPSLEGMVFDEHRGAETHGLPFDHYELHVWTEVTNPLGLRAPFNPSVTCAGA